ncbi:hypothetical protein [Pseudonocardia sp. NPDC049635]|uniref:hypothetical protein n=1 Tax=Pseudonocardia sp. NPDC049635 TaxID=3155506 RepID=UPI0033F2C4FA
MSTAHDPYRQRQREAVRQAPVTVRTAPGGPRPPEPERSAQRPAEPPLVDRLAALDRDDLVELAERHGIEAFRVRSTVLAAQLAERGIEPGSPAPTGGLTGVVPPGGE